MLTMAPRMPLLPLALALALAAALAACSRAQEPTASPSPDPTDAPTAAPTFDPTLLYQIEYTWDGDVTETTNCTAPPDSWQFRAAAVGDDGSPACVPTPCEYVVRDRVTTRTVCTASYAPPSGAYIIAATNWTDLTTCTGTPGRARGFAEGKCVLPRQGSGSIRYTCTQETIIVETCTDLTCGACSYASQSTVCAQSSGVSYYCVGDTDEIPRDPLTTEAIVVLSAIGVGVLLVGMGIGALIMHLRRPAKSSGYTSINDY